MLHENWRWRPGYRALQARLAEASPPKTFNFQCSSAGLLPAPDGTYPALQRQPFLAKLDRLIVFELLGHHLDVLHCLFGDVQILAARTERRCQAVIGEDFATVEVRAGATRGRLTGSFTKRGALTRPMDRLSLDGEVVISDMVLDWRGHRQEWTFDAAYQQSYDACIAHFVTCLQNDVPFATPAAHGIQLLDWIAEIYQLAHEKR
jgi:predicted dehydrogenase